MTNCSSLSMQIGSRRQCCWWASQPIRLPSISRQLMFLPLNSSCLTIILSILCFMLPTPTQTASLTMGSDDIVCLPKCFREQKTRNPVEVSRGGHNGSKFYHYSTLARSSCGQGAHLAFGGGLLRFSALSDCVDSTSNPCPATGSSYPAGAYYSLTRRPQRQRGPRFACARPDTIF